jgi:hypothetical protein
MRRALSLRRRIGMAIAHASGRDQAPAWSIFQAARDLRDLPGRIANAAPVGNIYSPFCCFRAMVYFTNLPPSGTAGQLAEQNKNRLVVDAGSRSCKLIWQAAYR